MAQPKSNPLAVDATIQRFEFALELFWKTCKRCLFLHGIETNSPRDTIIAAFQNHWISDQETWLQMLKDRNETSHVYDEMMAERIYSNVQQYLPVL